MAGDCDPAHVRGHRHPGRPDHRSGGAGRAHVDSDFRPDRGDDPQAVKASVGDQPWNGGTFQGKSGS